MTSKFGTDPVTVSRIQDCVEKHLDGQDKISVDIINNIQNEL